MKHYYPRYSIITKELIRKNHRFATLETIVAKIWKFFYEFKIRITESGKHVFITPEGYGGTLADGSQKMKQFENTMVFETKILDIQEEPVEKIQKFIKEWLVQEEKRLISNIEKALYKKDR